MTRKVERIVLVLCLVAAIVSVVFSPVSGFCETLRFVFMADGRGESLDDPINTPVLNAIIAQIKALSPQPAFVVFGGDMAYRGYIDPSYTFQKWKDLFAPLTSAGITLYTAIGNHELYHEHSSEGFLLDNQKEFQKVFSENPGNGPPGYERLVYSFTSPGGDAFFATLDPYYLTADVIPSGLGGYIDPTQLTWLTDQVAQTKATHKFLFIHTPYYYVTGGDPNEPLSSADDSFTKLWTILDDNRFDFYACGHSHLYSRKTIDSSILPHPQTDPPHPPWQNNVVQLLNGTCGAGVDTDTPTEDPALWHVFNTPDTYYFSVVDINGSQVTVNSYRGNTGDYTVFDSFTIVTAVTAIPKLIISLDQGTIGTEFTITGSGFGTRKGKVLLGTAISKIMQWADDSIQCQLTRVLPAGAYDVTIKPQTKGSSPMTISDGFTVEAPGIDSINPPSGLIGDEITIYGLFFGTTKGKVTLGGKSCRVSRWTMDSATGESEIQFVVPKGLSSGTRELKVTNSVGSDKTNFTVK